MNPRIEFESLSRRNETKADAKTAVASCKGFVVSRAFEPGVIRKPPGYLYVRKHT